MIKHIIQWSLEHRLAVILLSILLFGWGIYSTYNIAIDAIPDLSDTQVIIKTKYPGRSPNIVQEQVTYPLTTTMLAVPGAKTVRGFSYFGESFVYVIFDETVDLYWARSRVLEYFTQALNKLPADVIPALGPDATGVGWVYQYAIIDRTGQHDISQLRALQDWLLKFEIRSVPGVAEVAAIGGMVKQYQIILNLDRMRALQIPINQLISAIKNSNQTAGGSVIELAEAEYILQINGYLRSIEDFAQIPISTNENGVPVLLKHIAHIQVGPEPRRGIAEFNGEGEVAGGIVIMRYGQNALKVIKDVKQKLAAIKSSLPAGVEIIPTYDRSKVITESIKTLSKKIIEEAIVIMLVCGIFLFHFRSSLIIVITLPLAILIAFIVMQLQGITANIMSLGGIAIAAGTMVDAAIVMIENAHKDLEIAATQDPSIWTNLTKRTKIIMQAAIEVGPALFFSLLIITISFLPILTLKAQEGKLFSPLALTKTYAMAAAAVLSITLVPVLMDYFIRGRIPAEDSNLLNHFLTSWYKRLLVKILSFPKTTILAAVSLILVSIFPLSRLGMEFMPSLQEGDLLYMPSAYPGLSIGKAVQIVQQTDKLIKTIPEVATVFGKAGRADTATDPAPLEMLETVVQLKERKYWRPGMTLAKLTQELDQVVQVPGLVNLWVQPIRNRIDMLSTGIKSALGIKVAGPDLAVIENIGNQIETLLAPISGTKTIYAERTGQGRYIDININRGVAASYGLNVADIAEIIDKTIGGENVGEMIHGIERYPINLRYPRELRDSIEKLSNLPIMSPLKSMTNLSQIANIKIINGPAMYKSENARLAGWIYIDVAERDLGSYIKEAKEILAAKLQLPTSYSLAWSGQYEYLERVQQKMTIIVPLTIACILLMLFWIFKNMIEPLLIILFLPFAVSGGIWFIYALEYNVSLAVVIGFIALTGVAAEFGVVMLIYLKQAIVRHQRENRLQTEVDLKAAILEGAVLRVRPKSMTVSVILAGLLPIMVGHEIGSDVMQRIAAPMLGGMLTAPLLSMLIMPVVYLMWQKKLLSSTFISKVNN